MPLTHRPIPPLPACPRPKPIAPDVRRSYPTGRAEFSRAFAGSPMTLTLSTSGKFPPGVLATIVTTINAPDGEWLEIPFVRTNEQTFTCQIVPEKTGLFSFWTRFSCDSGKTWVHDPVPDAWVLVDPPQVDHLRMYSLIPAVSGKLPDWSKALHNIKAMGFDAVHLLPLTTLDTSQSPYSAKDFFGIDPGYLDPASKKSGLEQLEDFIQTAISLNIRLCFDLVLNHIGTDSYIATRAPEWIVPDPANPDGLRRARYWSGQGWLPWNDLVLIDYEHPSQKMQADIYAYMTEYALFWAHYANATNGFVRFDNLHSSDKPFVDSVSKALRDSYPNVGIIAEYFTDAATLLSTVPKWSLSLILATPWDSRFVPQLRDYLKYLHSMSQHVRFFMPITSHDSGSPAQEFGSVESTIPRYVAAALMGTGATGITQGVEWGIKEKINFIGKHPQLVPPAKPQFADFLRKVNDILVAEPAFRVGQNCQFVDDNHYAVIAVFRKDPRPSEKGLLVICNFDISRQHAFDVDLSKLLDTTATVNSTDLMNGKKYSFPNAHLSLLLDPCAAYIFKF